MSSLSVLGQKSEHHTYVVVIFLRGQQSFHEVGEASTELLRGQQSHEGASVRSVKS